MDAQDSKAEHAEALVLPGRNNSPFVVAAGQHYTDKSAYALLLRHHSEVNSAYALLISRVRWVARSLNSGDIV